MRTVDSDLPAVSCVCITYKRTNFLEEAIESFLRQDYQGQKELIIVNDDEDQTLVFNHPQVKIFNFKERFTTIGEKRNKSIELASYNILMLWDDDDIYLPHKISFGVNKLIDKQVDYYNLNQGFYYSMQDKIIKLSGNLFHANSCYTKDIFKAVKGYSHINLGEDADFQNKIFGINKPYLVENCFNSEHVQKADTTYFYRWGGVSYHLSLVGEEKNPLDKITEERLKSDPKKGIIDLNPHWKEDYVKMAKAYFQKI